MERLLLGVADERRASAQVVLVCSRVLRIPSPQALLFGRGQLQVERLGDPFSYHVLEAVQLVGAKLKPFRPDRFSRRHSIEPGGHSHHAGVAGHLAGKHQVGAGKVGVRYRSNQGPLLSSEPCRDRIREAGAKRRIHRG